MKLCIEQQNRDGNSKSNLEINKIESGRIEWELK